MLNDELCCNPGTRCTVCAGLHMLWISFAVYIAFAVFLNSVWNILVNSCPVWRKGLVTFPQCNVAPESATIEGIFPVWTSCWSSIIFCSFFFLLYAVLMCLINSGFSTHPEWGFTLCVIVLTLIHFHLYCVPMVCTLIVSTHALSFAQTSQLLAFVFNFIDVPLRLFIIICL